jgi:CRISPR-associated protein Csm5
MKEPMRFCLRTITPIHVGCDDVYEPMAFVINEEERKLISFDPFAFLKTLSDHDKRTFAEICKKGTAASILEIYAFMSKHRSYVDGDAVDVCPGLVEHYQKTLKISPRDVRTVQQELNKFTISRTAFTPNDNRPYIPGSSIKGALRTAYLNHCQQMKSIPAQRGAKAKDLELTLLDGGSFDTDPFRMLKVSDFSPVGKVKKAIIYAVNRKKKPTERQARGPYQILEVIEPGALFVGWLTVGKPEKGARIDTPLSFDSLASSANSFFKEEATREDRQLSLIGSQTTNVKAEGTTILVRLGRHSGAECVTIDGHRNIRIMLGGRDARFDKAATTLWLTANSGNPATNAHLKPFGWAVLEPLSETLTEEIAALEKAYFPRERTRRTARDASADSVEQRTRPEVPQIDMPSAPEWVVVVWKNACLNWSPGDKKLTASFENRKAFCEGKGLVPEVYHNKLFEKRKSVYATVEVEKIGNAFKIVKIEAES